METYYPYKGWDWTELCEALNVPTYRIDMGDGCGDLKAFDKYLQGDSSYSEWYYLQQYLLTVCGQSHSHWDGKDFVLRRTAFEVREYLKILADEDPGFCPPMWRGMAQIEDDWSLLQMFAQVCGSAWS